MNSITTFYRVIAMVCALSFSAVAGPQAVFELEKVERAADLVVVVDVLTCQQVGACEKTLNGRDYSCNRMEATCRVLEVFKGQTTKGQQIGVEFLEEKDVPLGLEDIRQGETSVLFLKAVHGELFVLANDQCSKVPLITFVPNITRLEGSLRENIGRQLIANLEDKNARQTENAICWANSIGCPIPEEVLVRMSKSTNLNIVVVALVPLVQQGNKPAIKDAINILLGEHQAADRTRVESLAWALEGSAKNLSVDQANKLAASRDTLVKRVGIRILGTVGDDSSVPVLIGGLDATDKDTQYSAVVALCRVTGQRGPSWREFMQNRDAEVMKRKTWGKGKNIDNQ